METNPEFKPVESTRPLWLGEYLGQSTVMPVPVKLDAAQFNAVDAVKVTVGVGGAAADAASVPVTALPGAIPAGTVIDFGGKKFARLTAPAAKNAVSLAVANLATALIAGDTGTYKGVGKRSLPSGILIGRTYAERDAGTPWGPADVAVDEEFYLTTRDLSDMSKDSTNEIYRHNKIVKENYLPEWATYPNEVKAKIRQLYQCIGGKD